MSEPKQVRRRPETEQSCPPPATPSASMTGNPARTELLQWLARIIARRLRAQDSTSGNPFHAQTPH